MKAAHTLSIFVVFITSFFIGCQNDNLKRFTDSLSEYEEIDFAQQQTVGIRRALVFRLKGKKDIYAVRSDRVTLVLVYGSNQTKPTFINTKEVWRNEWRENDKIWLDYATFELPSIDDLFLWQQTLESEKSKSVLFKNYTIQNRDNFIMVFKADPSLTVGNMWTIRWNVSGYGHSADVQIGIRDTRFNPDGGTPSGEETIMGRMKNTGELDWLIPTRLGNMKWNGGKVYKIVIYVKDSNGKGFIESPLFKVTG